MALPEEADNPLRRLEPSNPQAGSFQDLCTLGWVPGGAKIPF